MTDDDERIIEEVAKCVAAKEPLWEAARRIGWPWSKLARWIFEDTERCAAYSVFLRVRADELVFEAMTYKNDAIAISDGQPYVLRDAQGNIEHGDDGKPIIIETDVQRDALRGNMRFKGADLNFKVAGKWDRERYGETPLRIGINAGGGSLVQILMGMPVYEAQGVLAAPAQRSAIEHITQKAIEVVKPAVPVVTPVTAVDETGIADGAPALAAPVVKKRGRPKKVVESVSESEWI